jgi:hypothetical protein
MFVSGVFYLGSGSAAEAHCGRLACVIRPALSPVLSLLLHVKTAVRGRGGHTGKRREGSNGYCTEEELDLGQELG